MFLIMLLMKSATAHAQRLDDIVDIITFAWKNGDAKAIVAMAGKDGIVIETPAFRIGPIAARQATAVVRRIFDDRQTISLRQGMTQVVGGTPRRAFAEISWITRLPDTSQAERFTIYLELVLDGERWHITQIRLLP